MYSKIIIFVVSVVGYISAQSTVNDGMILPSTDVNLMNYYLYTSTISNVSIQYNNSTSLAASGFNALQPTTLIIDGFLSNNTNSLMSQTVKNALLSVNYAGNIIIVDWSALSGGTSAFLYSSLTSAAALALYPLVVANAPNVGNRVGQFINFLQVPTASVTIIGHSEGAHVAGIAGSYAKTNFGTLNQITGLDPAGPLYLYLSLSQALSPLNYIVQSNQLSSGDAAWVEVYHTSRGNNTLGLSLNNGFGTFGTQTGDLDIFVNGGNGQPNCWKIVDADPTKVINQAYCNHVYSWKYYSYIISSGSGSCGCNRGLLVGLLGSCVCATGCVTCSPANLTPIGYGNVAYGSTGGLYVATTISFN